MDTKWIQTSKALVLCGFQTFPTWKYCHLPCMPALIPILVTKSQSWTARTNVRTNGGQMSSKWWTNVTANAGQMYCNHLENADFPSIYADFPSLLPLVSNPLSIDSNCQQTAAERRQMPANGSRMPDKHLAILFHAAPHYLPCAAYLDLCAPFRIR